MVVGFGVGAYHASPFPASWSLILDNQAVISAVQHWVETLVVGLNLCPFAQRELLANRVRFSVSEATEELQLLADLEAELTLLVADAAIETSLLIHPQVLTDFYDYNQFLDTVDHLLLEMGLEGVFQVASFHPDYQFAGTAADDVENYTNRAPYPVLHLLRERSVEQAIAHYPDAELVPDKNIELLRNLGVEQILALLKPKN